MASALLVNAEAAALPWMVMVHGMTQDHRVFSSQVEAFKPRHRILLVDLPGHGLSSALGGPFGHLELAEHVHRTMADKGVEAATYWGTHTGATIGLLLAADSPEHVRALVLEAPLVPGNNPPVVLQAMERARQALRGDGLAAAIDGWWRDTCWFEYMRAHPERCRADAHLAMVRDFGGRPWSEDAPPRPVERIGETLARVAQPALIYNGAADHPEFLAAARRVADLLPNAQRHRVAESGGFPAWENPEATNRLVAAFLDSL